MSAPGTCHSGEEKREEREKQDKNEGPRDLGGLSWWLNSKESACKSGDGLQPLGGEDPLEEVMVTHSSILAWGIPRTEEPGRLPSTGFQESRHNLATTDNKKRPWKARSRDPTAQAPATNTPLSSLPYVCTSSPGCWQAPCPPRELYLSCKIQDFFWNSL